MAASKLIILRSPGKDDLGNLTGTYARLMRWYGEDWKKYFELINPPAILTSPAKHCRTAASILAEMLGSQTPYVLPMLGMIEGTSETLYQTAQGCCSESAVMICHSIACDLFVQRMSLLTRNPFAVPQPLKKGEAAFIDVIRGTVEFLPDYAQRAQPVENNLQPV